MTSPYPRHSRHVTGEGSAPRLTEDTSRGRAFGAISAAEGVAVLVGIASAGVLGELVGIISALILQGLGYVVGGAAVLGCRRMLSATTPREPVGLPRA
ncbi:hypothetical protein E1218_26955 [Kribbella turkmenica]|uniref:Uncharacterized protein n=1 Tax=Kribbella turkmenica TaxID=2530375 RepID=A0A4R4WFR1_9ACTN|nr:hypothetical protein [Kribbella turkmenica]TDD17938.1 hypothetical protein E1218_26955 [Kribbella turkmenica]